MGKQALRWMQTRTQPVRSHRPHFAQVRHCVGKFPVCADSNMKSSLFLLVPESSRATSALPIRVDNGRVGSPSPNWTISLKSSAVSYARQGPKQNSVTEPLNPENCFCSDSALSVSALTQIAPYTGFGVRYLCKEKLWLIFTQSLTARRCLLFTVYTWACLFAGRNRRQTVKSSLLCNLPPHFCLTTSLTVKTKLGKLGEDSGVTRVKLQQTSFGNYLASGGEVKVCFTPFFPLHSSRVN